MKRVIILSFLFAASQQIFGQKNEGGFNLERPKLVVGIMLDQMRLDYFYRYYDSYKPNGGFRRLLSEGFSCENAIIPYAQTVTAVGHSSVYTGSVPAFTGIIANEWYSKEKGRTVYCAEDNGVKILGGTDSSKPMSPKNLWTTTMTDELRLATNFKSKVIGVAIKDRASILPSGHTANAAYWYDDLSGNWISSTYYMDKLPDWVKKFNDRKLVDSFYRIGWNTLAPITQYTQSTSDNKSYEGKYNDDATVTFPHKFTAMIGKDYKAIRATPYGNTLTLMMAKKILEEENLGNRGVTDFLNLSLSSTDVIGHMYGPNSIEVEDVYRRVDIELGQFLDELDKRVGKGNYLLFLTADHAATQAPGFLKENKLPGNAITSPTKELNAAIREKFGIADAVINTYAYQVYLNDPALSNAKIKKSKVADFIIDYLNAKDEVYLAYNTEDINELNLPTEIKERFLKGFNPKLSGDIQIIMKPGHLYGSETGTNHGLWYPYDSHIPLMFYGWKVKPGQLNREVYMTDIAATITSMLHIQMPSGCIGKPIFEVWK